MTPNGAIADSVNGYRKTLPNFRHVTIESLAAQYGRDQIITVSVENVILADGTLIGPDREGDFDMMMRSLASGPRPEGITNGKLVHYNPQIRHDLQTLAHWTTTPDADLLIGQYIDRAARLMPIIRGGN